MPDVLTSPQVAAIFAVTPKAVRAWADEGKLPFFRTPGGARRYHRADVEKFLEEVGASMPEAS